MLYIWAISPCIVNGFVTKHFNIKRSVQKGFPLSMFLFVNFQEPLYWVLKKTIILPGTSRKKLGVADETSFIVANDVSIIECFSIITMLIHVKAHVQHHLLVN